MLVNQGDPVEELILPIVESSSGDIKHVYVLTLL